MEQMRDGVKGKDKGMLREKDELRVSVSVEAKGCESRRQRRCVVERVWSA